MTVREFVDELVNLVEKYVKGKELNANGLALCGSVLLAASEALRRELVEKEVEEDVELDEKEMEREEEIAEVEQEKEELEEVFESDFEEVEEEPVVDGSTEVAFEEDVEVGELPTESIEPEEPEPEPEEPEPDFEEPEPPKPQPPKPKQPEVKPKPKPKVTQPSKPSSLQRLSELLKKKKR